MLGTFTKLAIARTVLRKLSYSLAEDAANYWKKLPRKRVAAGAALVAGAGLVHQGTQAVKQDYQGFYPQRSPQ